ncbi:hypothetical protein V5799_002171 [Amblyomma americanum]|uniref:Nuclease HARBI1 n=1 Tax=Amblyomma americanum TaxID=6943 RepID=A0AAQ4CY37_AMBAM
MAWTYPARRNIIIALLLHRLRRKRRRSLYIRKVFDRRPWYGEYHHLVQELRQSDPEYHFKYFRMTKASFDKLLGLIYERILHPPTHRRPISPGERLAVTLRFLATGGSIQDIAMSYRIHASTVANIIKETLPAIYDCLKPAAPGGSDVRGDLLARVPRPQQGDPSGPELPGLRSYLRPRGYHFGQGPGQFPCPGPPPPEHQGKPQAPGAHCLEHLPAGGLDGLPAHRRCLPSTRQTPAPPELDWGMLQHTEKQPLGQSLAPPEGSGPPRDPQASHPGHCHRKGHQHRGPG